MYGSIEKRKTMHMMSEVQILPAASEIHNQQEIIVSGTMTTEYCIVEKMSHFVIDKFCMKQDLSVDTMNM